MKSLFQRKWGRGEGRFGQPRLRAPLATFDGGLLASPPAHSYIRGIEIQIRQARAADVSTIAEFNARMALETERRQLDRERLTQGVTALLRDPAKGVYYLAELGGAIVGQLLLTYEWSDWRNGNFWWLQSVYVRQEHRGRGVFRSLFEHVRRLATERKDVCGLRLYMDAHNAAARRVYEDLGMKRTAYELFELDFVLTEKQEIPA